MKQVREILRETAKRFPNKSALIFKGKEIVFRELEEQVLKLAQIFQNHGISKGDRVGIYLPNCPEYAYSYLAAFYLGAVAVPLDYMLKEEELTSCLNHSEAKILIAQDKTGVSLAAIKNNTPTLKHILFTNSLPEIKTDLPDVKISEADPSLIMYTSGTTGQPRGILLNYKHLEGSPEAMKHFVDLTDNDIKLAAIPLSHIGGFIYLQNCIHFGITVVLMDRFNPFEFLQNIQQYKITCFHIVPPMYNAILTLKEIERFDLSSLRWVVVFGAPSSPEILKRFQHYCPNAKLLNGWGMTETCPPNTVTPLNSDNIASVGKPAPNCEIKIINEAGQDLPAGDIGELIIRGWIVMEGYYKDPEATAEVFKDGWLYTGDLARFDNEGFLYIVGRKKEMIKVGGQLVYAPEVEAAFYKNDAIAEVAVIGIPDKMKGEAVKAFVVLKQDSKVTMEDLRYFAREHLANFKVPQSIDIVESLPKNRTGKIDKNVLKEMIGITK